MAPNPMNSHGFGDDHFAHTGMTFAVGRNPALMRGRLLHRPHRADALRARKEYKRNAACT